MVEGEAEIDMASREPKRYGNWITTDYTARKNEEAYEHVYILHHPDEERPACRPLRTGPAYDRQKARGAQFGCVNGFERPNYFGPLDADDNFDHDARSFRRGGWWQAAMAEAKAIRGGALRLGCEICGWRKGFPLASPQPAARDIIWRK